MADVDRQNKKARVAENGSAPKPVDDVVNDAIEETPEEKEKRRAERKARKEGRRKARETHAQEADGEAVIQVEEEKKEKRSKKGENGASHVNGNGNGNGAANASTDGAAPSAASVEPLSITLEGTGSEHFTAYTSFAGAEFNSQLASLTASFKAPTPVQGACWPPLMAGRDVIGLAETGSGKTLAFLLPVLHRILASGSLPKKPALLVLAPTRELAMQTATVCTAAEKATGLRKKEDQRRMLKRGVALVVGTPGRLEDLANEGALDLSGVTYAVLDEADRMLDLGFEPAVRALLSRTSKQRSTAMFSATWPPAVQAVAAAFIRDPITARVGMAHEAPEANKRVKQVVEVCEPHDKDRRLEALLKQYHSSRKNRVLIFALYKKEAARLERQLQQRGWACAAIHGDLSQPARSAALKAFRDGTCPLLVATDVAARGLDVPDVDVVLNYTFPLTIEDYVHRIGRTARAGRTGTAHTLFTKKDKGHSGELVNVMRSAGIEPPESLMAFGTSVKRKEHPLYGAHYKPSGDANQAPAKALHVKFD